MFRIVEEGVVITVNVNPRSKVPEIKIESDKLLIKVTSPPIGGKANKEVINLLAEFLGVKKKQIKIIEGEKSRVKKILIVTDDKDKIIRKIRN